MGRQEAATNFLGFPTATLSWSELAGVRHHHSLMILWADKRRSPAGIQQVDQRPPTKARSQKEFSTRRGRPNRPPRKAEEAVQVRPSSKARHEARPHQGESA